MGPTSNMALLLVGLLLLAFTSTPAESATSMEENIYASLFGGNSTYISKLRPVLNSSHHVEVTVEFDLLSIKNVDEVNSVFSVIGFFLAAWTDEHLTWNTADYGGVTAIMVPASTVWTPDFVLVNSAGEFYNKQFTDLFRVMIFSTGEVRWRYGGSFETTCDLDVSLYPFDVQYCSLQLESWTYAKTDVKLKHAKATVDIENYSTNSVWEIYTTKTQKSDVTYSSYAGVTFTKLSFDIFMARLKSYYMINMIVPPLFLAAIAAVSCLLPADSGEKVGLGITNLLAFSVYQLIIADSTPVSSVYTPLLTIWMLVMMCLSAIDTLVAMMILFLHHHLPNKPPQILRVIFLRGFATLFCMKHDVPPVEDSTKQGTVTPCEKDEVEGAIVSLDKESAVGGEGGEGATGLEKKVEEVLQQLKKITEDMESKAADEANIDEWKAIARVVDRLCFFFSIIVILVTSLGCFTQSGDMAARIKAAGY